MNGGWGMSGGWVGGGMYLPFHCDCGLKCCAQDCQMTHYFDWNFHKWFNFVNIFFFLQLRTGTNDTLSLPPGEWTSSVTSVVMSGAVKRERRMYISCMQFAVQLADVSPPSYSTSPITSSSSPPPLPIPLYTRTQYKHMLELDIWLYKYQEEKEEERNVPTKGT